MDEKVCSFECPGDSFACDATLNNAKAYKCIPFIKRCDGIFDCEDKLDEEGCGNFLRPRLE